MINYSTKRDILFVDKMFRARYNTALIGGGTLFTVICVTKDRFLAD
jgi:hypothetical protein